MLLKILKKCSNSSKKYTKLNAIFRHTRSSSSSSSSTSIFKPKFLDKNIDKKIFLFDKYSKFTFQRLIDLSNILCNDLLINLKKSDLDGQKVGVYCGNNYTYLISILGLIFFRLK